MEAPVYFNAEKAVGVRTPKPQNPIIIVLCN